MINKIDFTFPIVFYKDGGKYVQEIAELKVDTPEFEILKYMFKNDTQFQNLIFNIGQMQCIHKDLDGNLKWLTFLKKVDFLTFIHKYKNELLIDNASILFLKACTTDELMIELGKMKP